LGYCHDAVSTARQVCKEKLDHEAGVLKEYVGCTRATTRSSTFSCRTIWTDAATHKLKRLARVPL
jgi:hypothetical protein